MHIPAGPGEFRSRLCMKAKLLLPRSFTFCGRHVYRLNAMLTPFHRCRTSPCPDRRSISPHPPSFLPPSTLHLPFIILNLPISLPTPKGLYVVEATYT